MEYVRKLNMTVIQSEYKKEISFKYRVFLFFLIVFFTAFQVLILKNPIKDLKMIIVSKIIFDTCIISILTVVDNIIVIGLNCTYSDFSIRTVTYVVEACSIVVGVCLLVFNITKSRLWIDIVFFTFFFVSMYIRDNDYLNKQQVTAISQMADEAYTKYKEKYEKISADVERVNQKEEALMSVRINNAGNEKEKKKAKKQKRTFDIAYNLDPESHNFPDEPLEREYKGIYGMFWGRNLVRYYEMEVGCYIHELERAYKKSEVREKKLMLYEEEVENALRYIEGSPAERQIEKILGISRDYEGQSRKSYKLFKRSRFERKRKKY